ncbi:proline and serine-rich protein 2 isoform X2 [Lissotriton helveticus]
MFDLKQEDDHLKFLSHEEQSVLLFFEETLKSFQEDLTLNGSAAPRLLVEQVSFDSEPEDIIDLVLPARDSGEQNEEARENCEPKEEARASVELKEEALQDNVIWCNEKEPGPVQEEAPLVTFSPPAASPPQSPMEPARSSGLYSNEYPGDRQKLLGGVPTPVIVAEQILKKTDTGNLSPTSPNGERPVERRRDAATSPPPVHRDYFSYPSPPLSKGSHYPNNIVISKAGKEYNKTISKANVNVSQRRAQVLANLHTEGLSVEEVEDRMRHSQMIGRERSASFRDAASQQAKYEALIKLQLIKETPVQVEETPAEVETDHATNTHKPHYSPTKPLANGLDNINKVLTSEPSPFIPIGKTVAIPAATSPTEKRFTRQVPSHSIHDSSQARVQNEIRRTCSLPRPAGFRPQGISVQFSGRGATEESRKEALRQLGLLKKSA